VLGSKLDLMSYEAKLSSLSVKTIILPIFISVAKHLMVYTETTVRILIAFIIEQV
jgi:hypothetical protein